MGSAPNDDWDPTPATSCQLSSKCSVRIRRDLMTFCNDPPYGLFLVPDDQDITVIHALITGAFDTPYEGGFFYFILRCPPDYPLRPPKVKLMTTGGGEVRFNPNLYKNGKVCLSILGTWSGPNWSPAQSISSVLISIQSVLNDKPYHNEPGFEIEKLPGDVDRYNEIIQHETIRVAVIGMLENDSCLNIPSVLTDIMEKTFLELYDYYESTVTKKLNLTGHPMQDPFSEKRGLFQYKTLLGRLQALRAKLLAKQSAESQSGPGSDTDLDDDSSTSLSNSAATPPAIEDCKPCLKTSEDLTSTSKKNSDPSETVSKSAVVSSSEKTALNKVPEPHLTPASGDVGSTCTPEKLENSKDVCKELNETEMKSCKLSEDNS